MIVVRGIKKMQGLARKMKRQGLSIGLVPTMGALHQGHLRLIRLARQENQRVVVSTFVNPTQFGPGEDYKRYPRNFSKDTALCKKEGVDIIFYPRAQLMYPAEYKTYVYVEDLSDVLCGKFRPGHFRGVATVVSKLFNIVQPEVAYFGQKDMQQAIIIKRMAGDLNFPLKIKTVPCVREKDGLAMSSRNRYLNPAERRAAALLYAALSRTKKIVAEGCSDCRRIISEMARIIKRTKKAKIQYICVVDACNLKAIDKIKGRSLIALAVWIGKTRLIDNIILNPNPKRHG